MPSGHGVDRFRVGVLAPMPSELGPVVKAMHLHQSADGFYRGAVSGTDVVATKTGMGTELSAAAAERLLDAVKVDHVLVCGIAGGMGSTEVGEILYPEVVVDKASLAEYKPVPLANVESRGKLVTHDDFDMGPEEHEQLVADGFVAVDMETAAIAGVCERRGVPWSAVRVISDLVGVTPGDVIGLANPDGSPRIGAGLKYLVQHPGRIPGLVKLGMDSRNAATSAARQAQELISRR
jgi:adenosylhomocysteine nucleosidase